MNDTELRRIIETLVEFGLIDEPNLRKMLRDGSIRKGRNFGMQSYSKLCRIMGETPHGDDATKIKLLASLKSAKKRVEALKNALRSFR